MPKLSIIVPAYNVEKYIEKCLISIAHQKYSDYEVIIVDDGSTDQTGNICDDFVSENPQFKCIHKKNGGLVSARICGIENSTGDYIGYVDSDDWITEDYFFNMMKVIEQYSPDVVCSIYKETYVNDDGSVLAKNVNKQFDDGLYTGSKLIDLKTNVMYQKPYYNFGIYPSVWSKVFKKESFYNWQRNVPLNITLGEDEAAFYPFLQNSCQSLYIDNNNDGYYYRQSNNSMVHKYNPNLTNNIETLINYLNNYVDFDNINSVNNMMMYYGMIIKWGIGNELAAESSDEKIIDSISKFRESNAVSKIIELLDVTSFPITIRMLLTLFIKKKYPLILLSCRMVLLLKKQK